MDQFTTPKLDGVNPIELQAALMALEAVWAELFPREQARILRLLMEEVQYDAARNEVTFTFRPGGWKGIALDLSPVEES